MTAGRGTEGRSSVRLFRLFNPSFGDKSDIRVLFRAHSKMLFRLQALADVHTTAVLHDNVAASDHVAPDSHDNGD